MNDLISVVVPVYLAEKTLQKCIDSIQNQTFHNLEIILIDDGSFDDSAEMCNAIAKRDKRVIVIHLPNAGAGNARNLGIEISIGKFLAFVDSDDFVDLGMFYDLYSYLVTGCSDCVVSAVGSKGLFPNTSISFSKKSDYEKICALFESSNLYAPWAKLYSSSVIKSNQITFPTDLNYGEDLVFNVRYMHHIDNISYVNINYYHYIRNNQDSLSQKIRWNMFENDMVFETQLQELLIEKKLLFGKMKEYDAYRILGVAYDSLFLLTRKDCPFHNKNISRYIKNIINDKYVQWSLSVADTSKYAQWMIRSMKQRKVWMIQMLCYIKRKTA